MVRIAVFFSLSLILCQCTHPSPQAETKQEADTLPKEEQEALEAKPNEGEAILSHPEPEDYDRLDFWLKSQEIPFSIERLNDCQAWFLQKTEARLDRKQLDALVRENLDDVLSQTSLYHWCFYQKLQRFAYQMRQSDLNLGYQEKMDRFLHESRALFVLAEALSTARNELSYRQIFRHSFRQLSQEIFGRRLVPFDSQTPKKRDKPAQKFQE